MNELFEELAFSDTEFSQEVKLGRASIDLKDSAEYLGGILQTSTRNIEKFRYVGYRYMTPFEEFDSLLTQGDGKPKQGKVKLDISKTSIRKVIFEFAYDDRPIYKPLYVLALNNEGTYHISDTEWYNMPVLSDKIIAFFGGALFFKPFNTKLNVRDFEWLLNVNGVASTEIILYADKFYQLRKISNPAFGTPNVPFLLYTLAKYGLSGVLKKYIKNKTFIITRDKEEIAKYNDGKHLIFTTAHSKIKRLKDIKYETHDKAVIIDSNSNDFIRILATSVIYAFDIFPDIANAFEEIRCLEDDIEYWKFLVGKIEFRDDLSSTGYVPAMREFEEAMGRYVDSISSDQAKSAGYNIKDFWDFIYTSGKVFKKLKRQSLSNRFDISEKHLEVNYYVMYHMIEGFNKAFADITKQVKANSISWESANKIVNGEKIKPMSILKIVQSSSKILSSLLVTSTSANRYFKVTCMMDVQERGTGVKAPSKNSSNVFPPSIKKLRGGHVYVGSMFGLNKTAPSPLLRLNPNAMFGKNGEVLLTEQEKINCHLIDVALNNVIKDNDAATEYVSSLATSDDGILKD
jgi:hypothetical protein